MNLNKVESHPLKLLIMKLINLNPSLLGLANPRSIGHNWSTKSLPVGQDRTHPAALGNVWWGSREWRRGSRLVGVTWNDLRDSRKSDGWRWFWHGWREAGVWRAAESPRTVARLPGRSRTTPSSFWLISIFTLKVFTLYTYADNNLEMGPNQLHK